ncbi:protein NRT1/ PTR FAMILY 5.14-like isoform X2 [Mercurialis annua]|uniref:protein NRT1/ PTR FAMILY 5.14-like isoform X2 n=1 Tax=Mercurialis annua TaxID=3986 RepID=UPI00215F2145|nr:protein NRT1/ PTR FAMILY 5.14-like isoform X2 [Mercurialis annua]
MEDIVDGSVDYNGRPINRSSSGGWRSASFIIAVEVAERFAYFGISCNLITYLTTYLGQSTATAAENVNIWSGTSTLLPLVGAVVADSFLGRYCTIILASFVYILGLSLLTLSAALTSQNITKCRNSENKTSCEPPRYQVMLFFLSLYLVAVGQGGHKPNVQAFGADQFDGKHPKEKIAKNSFFNWWLFSLSFGIAFTFIALVYIQENLNWVLGFGIPCIALLAALLIFLIGSRTYRYSDKKNIKNPFTCAGHVISRAIGNCRKAWKNSSRIARETEEGAFLIDQSELFKFENEAQVQIGDGAMKDEARALLRLIPIWVTSLPYAIVFAQIGTFFTKQGLTMDTTFFPGFQIPPASLQSFVTFPIIILIPIYDRIFLPLARFLSGNRHGITMLQRAGTGMIISTSSMVIASLIEQKRLKTARDYGLVDLPNTKIPMSIWWLVPQYVLCGVSDVFTIVGLQEFFYDQVGDDLRSVGLSLFFSVMGVGHFLSSFLVRVIDRVTDRDGLESWFSNNLNRAHLDYFYCLLAILNALGTPLIEDTVDGSVDYKGRPVYRSSSGGWRSASFLIAVEVAERFAYFGISANLITYLTGSLGQSTARAAVNVNTWSGTATLLPLLGGVVADSFLGRYFTIIFASLIYILGLGLLTISAALTTDCNTNNSSTSCGPPRYQVGLFFFSLYLVAVGQGGHKPCVIAFGADQFDAKHPKESIAKSSYFNWCYFTISVGITATMMVVVYIQENFNWVLGFGIPCIFMLAALLLFLLGSMNYRYSVKRNEKNPFTRIGQVIVRSIGNRRKTSSSTASEEEIYVYEQTSERLKFLNKALISSDDSTKDSEVCSVRDVEETKALLRLIPIWITSLPYAIVFAQTTTFFTKQGVTMDRTTFQGFKIPAASLQSFIGFSIITFIPIYDCIFVPFARFLTKNPSGITMLQRIGTGMFISTLSVITAALTEQKRLHTAKEYRMVDQPNAIVPMSIWWLVPQYALCGAADVFTIVGLQEFFYDQVPEELRSVGLSLYLSVIGVGSFISSFLVSIIDKATERDGEESWFSDDLNKAHLDRFYWLLAALSALGFIVFLCFGRSYIYRRTN